MIIVIKQYITHIVKCMKFSLKVTVFNSYSKHNHHLYKHENKRMEDMLFLDKRVISRGIAILVSFTLNTYL